MSVIKSEKAFRTITETAEILELPAHVLRFWESKFKYIKPMKRGGGRRYYRPEDIHLLLGIKYLLHSKGLTIKGTQKVIQSSGIKSIAKLGADKILNTNTPSTLSVKPKNKAPKTLSIQSLNLQKIKMPHNIDSKTLEDILGKVRQIHDRIRNRCKKKIVA